MGANTAEPAESGAEPLDTGLGETAGDELARAALTLARRFAAGATLWCLAPEWPEHGRHVAVEFVHPVVIGTRALPAVNVGTGDPVGALRTDATTGDALVVIAPDTSATARDVLRRAPTWGVTTIWIGAGERPPADAADHLVWLEGPGAAATARHDGRMVLRYHVLWELTHVCFEHPGLLRDPNAGCDDEAGVCITCSDDALPAEVAEVLDGGLVSVRTARGPETVDTTLVGEVRRGDLVLIHAGTAIERLEPAGG